MTLPDLLVLGAARAATTSLHYYLEQHPTITMSSVKEPNYFAFDHAKVPPAPLFDAEAIATKSVTDRAGYEALFSHARPGDVVGEASPLYLYVREAPEQIAKVLDRPRFVAVLRNPIDRAYSHWLHIHRLPADQAVRGFRAACAAEMALGPGYTAYASGTHVLRMGRYDEQLDRYASRFGRPSLLALDYAEVTTQPQTSLDRICDHVGAARHAFDTEVQYNRSGVASGRVAAGLAGALRAAQPRVKAALPPAVVRRLGRLRATYDRPRAAPTVPPDLRAELVEWFAPSVARLVADGWIGADVWPEFA
ncbi:MAG TPA: sulfotransferase [Acidimicrobiales bacterium]|nr:sulfotransferase [Acidimicrobiales bacterium]